VHWPGNPNIHYGRIGRGAQSGILVKDASAIEKLNKVDILIVDKTGTLTEGKPKLKEYKSFGNLSDKEVLKLGHQLIPLVFIR